MADYKDKYYELFTNTMINREDLNIAMNRIINRFNVIFLE
jgi:hypothetical protein